MPKTVNKSAKPAEEDKKLLSSKVDFDYAALVASELGGDSSPKFSKKRKARVVESSSPEVEFVPSPVTKKPRSQVKPTPGSEEFKKLSAVSVTAALDQLMEESSTNDVVFGSVSDSTVTRPKRVRTQTAKAAGKDSLAIPRKLGRASQSPADKKAKIITKIKLEKEVPVVNGSPRELSADVGDDLPSVAELISFYKQSVVPDVRAAHGSPGEEVALDKASHTQSDTLSADGEAGDRELGSDTVWEGIDGPALPSNDSPGTNVEGAEAVNDDDGSTVMIDALQDPLLVPIYKELPELSRLCEVQPFGKTTTETLRTPFAETCEKLSKNEVQSLLKALLFVKSGQYVNLARVDPKHLYVDERRIKNVDGKKLSVGVMTGTVTESFLFTPVEGGPGSGPWTLHKITIAPFTQDIRRETSLWGLLLGFDLIRGLTGPYGFSFTTQGEEHRGNTSSSSLLTVMPHTSVLRSVSSTLVTKNASKGYNAYREFHEVVPVYDGRATEDRLAFAFSDNDFRRLLSWPRYMKGQVEIPANALVSVGYTVGTYLGKNGTLNLSTNVQFVIVLAVPECV